MKKKLLVLAVFLFTLMAGPLMAQFQKSVDAVTDAQLAKEPALTAIDVQNIIDLANGVAKFEEVQERLVFTEKFAKDRKISNVRLRYIMEKVPCVLLYLEDPAKEALFGGGKAWRRPTEAEKNLVKAKKDELRQAIDQRS
ncbi:MAG: hypothetical protein LBS60_00095 [Deltaproteobacteria bacterium]|jgi:hypothetical protein|nr:hypothetical protein [Deltaproteobacteria bacterium]